MHTPGHGTTDDYWELWFYLSDLPTKVGWDTMSFFIWPACTHMHGPRWKCSICSPHFRYDGASSRDFHSCGKTFLSVQDVDRWNIDASVTVAAMEWSIFFMEIMIHTLIHSVFLLFLSFKDIRNRGSYELPERPRCDYSHQKLWGNLKIWDHIVGAKDTFLKLWIAHVNGSE